MDRLSRGKFFEHLPFPMGAVPFTKDEDWKPIIKLLKQECKIQWDDVKSFENQNSSELYAETKSIYENDKIFERETRKKIQFIFYDPNKTEGEIKQKDSSKGKYTFIKRGDFWSIIFKGKELPHLKHMDGFDYIHYLLLRPGEEISSLDLYYAVKKIEKDLKTNITNNIFIDEEALYEKDTDEENTYAKKEIKSFGELKISHGNRNIELLDEKAKDNYIKRLFELKKDREEALENNDPTEIERIDREFSLIEKELKNAAYDLKKAPIFDEKARKNVSRGIKYCIKKIYLHDKNLAKYLDNMIRVGYYCVYILDLDDPIKWSF